MKTITSIQRHFVSGRQSRELLHTYSDQAGRKLRVSIDRDSYDFQSSGVVELWTGERWNEVASIPYQELICLGGSPYAPTHDALDELLAEDEDRLMRIAKEILDA